MGFGQFAATSQFFLYGRRHFTSTGWKKHSKSYEQPDLLSQPLDLSERVYLITGSNSGIGKEIAQFLAGAGATVYMLCRSRERAEAAAAEIRSTVAHARVHVLVGDVGLEKDVRRCWREFKEHAGSEMPRLDGLVCNAGALLNSRTLTEENLEVTFASHLLFGTYLLGSLAMPHLEATAGSRLVVVSSGGMYNVPFPSWEVATSTSPSAGAKYDGQLAYAYAKRGQVLLCERWAAEHTSVKVVTCHPGWTSTPAVEAAYGDQKSLLEPMRSAWQGAEGIIWLCVAPAKKLESGAFYLDRAPQVKHLAGPFFTEGSYTKNSREQVDEMERKLEAWANGQRPSDPVGSSELQAAKAQAALTRLVAQKDPIDVNRFMGRWYVVANIPTFFDRDTVNNIEEYSYDAQTKQIQVTFTYSNKELTKTSQLQQRATVVNKAGTEWKLSPKFGVYLPLGIAYLIVECAADYSTCIVGVPDRSYAWMMARSPFPEPSVVEAMVRKAQDLGYDTSSLAYPAQIWKEGELPPLDAQAQGA